MANSTVIAGVDACRAGWVVLYAQLDGYDQIKIEVLPRFSDVIGLLGPQAVIAVDIPIGLLDRYEPGGRTCDRLARKQLGPRAPSVFPAPVRPTLLARDYRDACRLSQESDPAGKALSKQAFCLIPKIREVDELLRARGSARSHVIETHPELAFLHLAGRTLSPKKSKQGYTERIAVLRTAGLPDPTALPLGRRAGFQQDDLVDAAVCLLVAAEVARGEASSISASPPMDRFGLPMRIVVGRANDPTGSAIPFDLPKKRPTESDLLAHIYHLAGGINAASGDILVGPGDDCAVVRTPSGDVLLLTVDQVVEGRHFEPATPIDLIARKAIARSISDIAAMGGQPAWGLVTGLLPDGYQHGRELSEALHKWGRHWGCPIVGGDIAFGPGPLAVTVTVVGGMGEGTEARSEQATKRRSDEATKGVAGVSALEPLLRSGAQVGDELWLTGQVGGSLASGWHLRFEPRLAAGRAAALSGRIHAMIDLSDGLGRDAARVGVASGVRLEIEAARLPISHHCRGWAEAVREGEDYELLMAVRPREPGLEGPPLAAEPAMMGPIGLVRACAPGEKPGATIIDPYGKAHDAGELGWDHGG